MPRKQRPGQVGDYWPSKRPNSPFWCRTWYDHASGQTKRASLGTEDFQEAYTTLLDWHARNIVMRQSPADQVLLSQVFVAYWEKHASKIPSAKSAKRHLDLAVELLSEGPLVSDFGLARQEDFVEQLRERGYTRGYIKRIFATLGAAIRWAWKRGMITSHNPLLDNLPKSPKRDRALTVEQVAALYNAAGQTPHLQQFIIVMLATAARPAAALQLTRFQCDMRDRLVDLNPPGREQTAKRRPIIPMAHALRELVMTSTGGHLVEWQGRPVESVKTAWNKAKARAGLGAEVQPYSLRHTVGTEMARRNVPQWQRECFMGHSADNTTGRDYEHSRPGYLQEAREAVDSLISEVVRVAARTTNDPVNQDVRATSVLASQVKGAGNP